MLVSKHKSPSLCTVSKCTKQCLIHTNADPTPSCPLWLGALKSVSKIDFPRHLLYM